MDEENEREVRDREFEERVGGMRRRDEEVLRRNREKREKARARKKKGGKGGGGGEGPDGKEGGDVGTKRKLGPARVAGAGREDAAVEEDGRTGQNDGNRDSGTGGEDGAEGGEGGGGITIHDDD